MYKQGPALGGRRTPPPTSLASTHMQAVTQGLGLEPGKAFPLGWKQSVGPSGAPQASRLPAANWVGRYGPVSHIP